MLMKQILRLQSVNSSDFEILSVAGFDPRNCHGSILIWNNGSAVEDLTVNAINVPFSNFTVQAYQLDADHMPGVRCTSDTLFFCSSDACASSDIIKVQAALNTRATLLISRCAKAAFAIPCVDLCTRQTRQEGNVRLRRTL